MADGRVVIDIDANGSQAIGETEKVKKSLFGLGPAAEKSNGGFGSIVKSSALFGTVAGAAMAVVTGGINAMKSSLGGAVARFDTLNAYPKVMAQMGYSTDDVTKSVGILKKGVDGLPTSLQDLTKSAQGFAILEKSATKGAETATALNDAFLASGASAGDASRGVEQYSQMLASGTVDLQSWRTLQETMPYALTKVANSFGLTGKSAERDLYAKLKSGQITVDQLNARFVELDGGVNGFANTARTASGGIGTSFTNMKNAVVNGLTNMLTAIDNGLKNAGIVNGIAGIFDQAKRAIISSFAVINKVIQTTIPIIIDIFKKLYPVVKNLAPLIAGLGGGFIAASIGVTAFVKAASGISTVLGAIYKHPILAMIVLLATAFYEAYVNIKPFHDFVDKLVKKLGDLATQVPKTTGGLDGLKAVFGFLGGAMGVGVVIAGISKFKNGLKSAQGVLSKTASPLEAVKNGVEGIGKKAGGASPKLMGIATAILEIGAGVGIAATGLGIMAFGFSSLAKTGSDGLLVIGAMVLAIVSIAGAFALLSPVLTAGAVGIGVFGAAILAIGIGIGIASFGLSALITAIDNTNLSFSQIINTMAVVGIGFAEMLTGFVTTLADNMPIISASLLNMLVSFLAQLVVYTPIITQQFIQIILSFLNTITNNIQPISIAVTNMLVAMMTAVATNAPTLIAAFTNMVIAILQSLTDNMPNFVKAGADFLISLLNGIARQMPRIIDSGVNVILSFINGIANNLGRIIQAGIDLIAKFVMGIVNAMPQLTSIALQAVFKFVYGVGNALGQVMGSGRQLLSIFVQGIMNGFGQAQSSGSGASNAVMRGIQSISLFRAGAAIMQSFLGGLQSMWGSITSFVGGIASWIKQHKGPISYDKKLLIPAGKAIMTGFGNALEDHFADIKTSVSSFAGQISEVMATGIDNNANTVVNAMSNMVDSAISAVQDADIAGSVQDAFNVSPQVSALLGGKFTAEGSIASAGGAQANAINTTNSSTQTHVQNITFGQVVWNGKDDIQKTLEDLGWQDNINRRGAMA